MDERVGEKTSEGELARSTVPAEPARKRSLVQIAVALMVCGAALFWAFRTARDGMRPTAGWAKQLRTGDVDDRQTAARQLGGSGPEDVQFAIPTLLNAVNDESPVIRAEVASSLGLAAITALRASGKQAEVKDAAKALVGALSDPEPDVRRAAASAVAEMAGLPKDVEFPFDPATVISALVGLLTEPSEMVRTEGESALIRVASRSSTEPPAALIEGVNRWRLKESRQSAAFVLGGFKVGVGPMVAALDKALKDQDPGVRSAAAVSLRRLGAESAPALPALIATLADPFVPPPPSQFQFSVSVSAPGGGMADFSGGPGREPTDPAAQAARAIGRIVSVMAEKGTKLQDEATEALTKALHNDRPALKNAAQEALRMIGTGAASAIPGLIKALAEATSKPEPGFGPTAAQALGDLGPGTEPASGAIAGLTAALDANAPETRIAAVKALARFGPAASSALPKLRELGEGTGGDATFVGLVKATSDRIEGKAPPDSARRKGQGRGGRGGPRPL